MEKIFRACAGLVCAYLLAFNVSAQQNLVNIPDVNFRNALKIDYALSSSFVGDQLDANSNAVKTLTYLYLNGRSISNLEGLQYFTGVTNLSFADNNVVTLPELPSGLRNLSCSYNQITSFPAFPASLIMIDCRNNQLVNLPALPTGLRQFSCSNNLLVSLPALPQGLDSLVCANNKLTALPALPNDLFALNCSNNLLTSLPALPSNLAELNCSGNSITCLPFLPANLWRLITDAELCLPNLPNDRFIHVDATGNAFTKTLCNDLTNKNACNEYPIASGRVYIDTDNSGTFTEGDIALSKASIDASPYTIEADADGHYQVSFENLNVDYTIAPKFALAYTSSPANYSVNFSSYGQKQINKDFIVTGSAVDLSVSLVGVGRTAPGFETVYVITVRNNGTTTQNADITFDFDNVLVFNPNSPLPATNTGGVLTWSLTGLKPFQEKSFSAYFTVPASVTLGTELVGVASVATVSGDAVPANNTETLKQIVRGSYDPNDKQVNKGGEVLREEIASQDDFLYTVRFQNTGTDTAYTVVIRDTLSTKLDLSTMQTVTASHNYSFTMKDNAAAWTFNNIKLPDSTIDKAGSNGFVKYRIKPKATLQVDEEIDNTAHIYFDFNEAVITNTVITKVTEKRVTSLSDEKLAGLSTVYPNPSKGVFNLELGTADPARVEVYSTDGRVVAVHSNVVNKLTLDLTGHSSGIYFLRVNGLVKKLVLE